MKKTYLIPLLLFAITAGCKKDIATESEITSSTSNAKSSSKISSLTSRLLTDSLTDLRSEFSLQHSDSIPSDLPSVSFNSVNEAREFLNSMSTSTFVKKPVTQQSASVNLSKNRSISTQGFGFGDKMFALWLPAATLIIKKKYRVDWPTGFVVQGEIDGEGFYRTGSSRWGWERMTCDHPTVDLYGFTFMTSYESRVVSFRQQGFGPVVAIQFAGMLKMVLVIKDLGEIYSKPIQGFVTATFGPWLLYPGDEPGMSNEFNRPTSFTLR